MIRSGIRSNAVLGVRVHAVDMQSTLRMVNDWVQCDQGRYICCTPAHAVMACYDRPALREIYNQSALSTPDGMAIVWLLRWRGLKETRRVYGPDLMEAVCSYGLEKSWRHFLWGGAPGVAQQVSRSLTGKFPGLQVVGVESPPFHQLSWQESTQVRARILASGANIVWVAIGSPRQEQWMAENSPMLPGITLVGVGAAFDFISGAKRQAPKLVQRIGMEWFFRLLSEPFRLFRRYVLGYPRFVFLVFLETVGLLKVTSPH